MAPVGSGQPTTVGRGPGCEVVSEGLLVEPVSAVTSLAFVLAAVVIVLAARHGSPGRIAVYAALVAAVGLGSVIQHGPDPPWSDPVHDLPLLAVLTFLAADAVADLSGRRRAWWW